MRKAMWALSGVMAVALLVTFAWAQDAAQPAPAAGAAVIFDFENEEDIKTCEAKADTTTETSAEHATSGKQSLKVTLKGGADYPGLYAEKFAPKDWSPYMRLKIDVFSDSDVTMGLSIKDPKSKDYATRYNNDKVKIQKGANTISIDLVDVGDAIDLKTIKSISFFAHKPEKDVVLYVDNVRLEK